MEISSLTVQAVENLLANYLFYFKDYFALFDWSSPAHLRAEVKSVRSTGCTVSHRTFVPLKLAGATPTDPLYRVTLPSTSPAEFLTVFRVM